jgi:2,4-dienoyl-CoA reductase-like NADH-dependent reductase (Old Yellow Enzyme family)
MGEPLEPTMPKELTIEEIQQIVEACGDGARRRQEAGFDKKTSRDFPMLCRISGADLLDGKGHNLEDTKTRRRRRLSSNRPV